MDKNILLSNINSIHTTKMGEERIRKNLKTNEKDIIKYFKSKILNQNAYIYRQGKNWYCEIENIKITINAYTYTIITAHIIKKIEHERND